MIMYYTPTILIPRMKVRIKILVCYEYSNKFITEILICCEYSNKFIQTKWTLACQSSTSPLPRPPAPPIKWYIK